MSALPSLNTVISLPIYAGACLVSLVIGGVVVGVSTLSSLYPKALKIIDTANLKVKEAPPKSILYLTQAAADAATGFKILAQGSSEGGSGLPGDKSTALLGNALGGNIPIANAEVVDELNPLNVLGNPVNNPNLKNPVINAATNLQIPEALPLPYDISPSAPPIPKGPSQQQPGQQTGNLNNITKLASRVFPHNFAKLKNATGQLNNAAGNFNDANIAGNNVRKKFTSALKNKSIAGKVIGVNNEFNNAVGKYDEHGKTVSGKAGYLLGLTPDIGPKSSYGTRAFNGSRDLHRQIVTNGGGGKTRSNRKTRSEQKVNVPNRKPRTKKCLVTKGNQMYMSFCI